MERKFECEGTLCKYATASVDTPQPVPTRNFSSTRYFLFRREGTVQYRYRTVFSIVYRVLFFAMAWHASRRSSYGSSYARRFDVQKYSISAVLYRNFVLLPSRRLSPQWVYYSTLHPDRTRLSASVGLLQYITSRLYILVSHRTSNIEGCITIIIHTA